MRGTRGASLSAFIAAIGMVVLIVVAAPPDAVAETVRFPVAATPPTPLQERLARERGVPLPSLAKPPTVEVTGELYRPAGDGPFPAVVSLHGCAGPPSPERIEAAGAAYVALGYAVLIVDSFGPRGVTQRCITGYGTPVDRLMDAYGALLYLAGLPLIDPDRIAVVGYSQGADVALDAVRQGGVESQFARHFRAAIAYFPTCTDSYGDVTVPTVILIGDLDEWTPAQACRDMMARRSGAGAAPRLVIYPGAHHSFTAIRLRGKPETTYGYRNEYNEAAARAAWEEERAVLREAFGR